MLIFSPPWASGRIPKTLLFVLVLFVASSCANAPGKSFFGGGAEKKEEQKAAGEGSQAVIPAPLETSSPKAETGAAAPAPESEAAKENKQEKTDTLPASPPRPLALSKPKELPPAVEKDYVVLSGQGATANIRSGPGRDFAIIGKFPVGERFELAGESKELHEGKPWYKILDQNGNEAYVWSGLAEKTRGEKKRFGEALSPFANVKTGDTLTPSVPDELKQTKELSLNFEAVDIREIIQTFSELLKLDYIIEPGIAGEVTLHTSNKIPVQNLFKVFEQILTMNGIAMIKKETFYHFIPMPEAKSNPIGLYHGKNKEGIPDEDRMIIQIIPLKYILSRNVQPTVAPLLSKNAHFINQETTNTLIIVEIASNMRRLVEIIGALDVNNIENTDIEMFSINYSDALEVGKALQEVFTNLGYANTGPVSLKLVPVKNLNSILVVNTIPNLLPVVESWIKKLDQPKVEGQTATFVYYLQNAESGNMASLLTSIYGSKKSKKDAEEEMRLRRAKKEDVAKEPKPAAERREEKKTTPLAPQAKVEGAQELATGEIEGEVSVIADTDTNALIVRTDPKNYPAIEDTIKKLDRMPLQVLIEAMIMDVALDENTKFGVEWALKGAAESNGSGINFATKSSQGGKNAGFFEGGPSAIQQTSLFNDTAGTLGLYVGSASKVMSMLHAYGLDKKTNVLSSPIVITSDNKPSTISITNQIPITSATYTATTSATTGYVLPSTIEYRDVGIKLKVTPKINDDRFVVLEVSQEVSGVLPSAQGETNPRFYSRTAETNVVVKDKETIILGGLMQTTKSNTKTGVPFLSDIPIFGNLFSAKEDNLNKSELLIFITPHVIMNTQEGRVVTKEFREKLKLLKDATQQINIGGAPEEVPVGQ